MKFGVQAAIQGVKFDFSTITSKILSKKIYIKAMIIPTAKFKPIPPLFLNEDTATAIIVKISAETGIDHLLFRSNKCWFINGLPFLFSKSMNSLSSKKFKVCAL